jgi:hypothetical protein
MALCIIGFFYAFAAQIKASDNYWLRHTVVGWCFRQTGGVLRWILKQAGRVLDWVGLGFKALGRGFRAMGRSVRAVFLMLPVIWQWIVTAAAMALTPVIFFLLTISCHGIIELFWGFLCMLSVMADIAIVLYGGWCFGTLLKGIENMSKGDINHKIEAILLREILNGGKDLTLYWLNKFHTLLHKFAIGAKQRLLILGSLSLKIQNLMLHLLTHRGRERRTLLDITIV